MEPMGLWDSLQPRCGCHNLTPRWPLRLKSNEVSFAQTGSPWPWPLPRWVALANGCPSLSLKSVPHKTPLPEGVRVGTVMRIRGVVPDKAGRFYVNLLCSEEGSEAALHFNPRLDESVVVFNTKEGGAWGREERGRGFPFQRGQPFEVLLIPTQDGFKTVVGDSEYHHFHYRIPPERVRVVEVGGDLQLESVKIF
ncbi:galectin-7 isoform X2 [Rousettus aegyptiacus]|uniref:galectin-7 isoform X2 n=1 Tax=Rousettus aegyptiacus TaxID=9407 RepID=UPI00168CED1A|nr:galectin-7 isoform X2 [Rousettus aegyptiacus]